MIATTCHWPHAVRMGDSAMLDSKEVNRGYELVSYVCYWLSSGLIGSVSYWTEGNECLEDSLS